MRARHSEAEANAEVYLMHSLTQEASALRALVPDALPAPAPAPVRDEDESDDEVMPTRKKRGYVTLSDRPPAASRPSKPPDTSSSDDEVMPTKRPRGPPKKRN